MIREKFELINILWSGGHSFALAIYSVPGWRWHGLRYLGLRWLMFLTVLYMYLSLSVLRVIENVSLIIRIEDLVFQFRSMIS